MKNLLFISSRAEQSSPDQLVVYKILLEIQKATGSYIRIHYFFNIAWNQFENCY